MKKYYSLQALSLAALMILLIISGQLLANNEEATAGKRPNILYIMADDHGSGAISAYGSKLIKTPNIDSLATQGMRFNSSFVTCSICMPSRAVLITGKYNHINGVEEFKNSFDGSQMTFPKLLQKAGYTTGITGKWHLKSKPKGYDYWKVLPGQGKYHNPQWITPEGENIQNGFVTDIIADETIAFMKKAKESGKPFMFMCHFKAPHTRHDYHPRYEKEFAEDLPYPSTFNDNYETRQLASYAAWWTQIEDMAVHVRRKPPKDLKDPAQLRKWYYQEFFKGYLRLVRGVDDNVGRIMKYLKESGLDKNTIVIYTSDNGFFIGDHGWFNKMWMYEQSLKVPLIVCYPNHIKPSVNHDDMVLNLDMAPTILDFAQTQIPAEMQGRSMKEILLGNTPDNWRQSIYYHYKCKFGVPGHYGIRTPNHKMIHFYKAENEGQEPNWELFLLDEDPDEMNNVYDNPAHENIQTKLHNELQRLQKKYKDPIKE